MKLVISGDGAVAEEITSMAGKRGVMCSSFLAYQKDPLTFVMCDDVVAIHVGEGEELPALVDTCRQKGWPLIHRSAGPPVVELPNMRGIQRYSITGHTEPAEYFELAEVLTH